MPSVHTGCAVASQTIVHWSERRWPNGGHCGSAGCSRYQPSPEHFQKARRDLGEGTSVAGGVYVSNSFM